MVGIVTSAVDAAIVLAGFSLWDLTNLSVPCTPALKKAINMFAALILAPIR